MKPIAWFDPSNGVVSTDQDSPLFTPLGQVWPLYPKGEWVGLTDKERSQLVTLHHGWNEFGQAIEHALKEKNT